MTLAYVLAFGHLAVFAYIAGQIHLFTRATINTLGEEKLPEPQHVISAGTLDAFAGALGQHGVALNEVREAQVAHSQALVTIQQTLDYIIRQAKLDQAQ